MGAHLILTVDYEIFGNGQGCLQHCVVQPATQLLRVAEKFQAPVTLFAEAAELMAMEEQIGPGAVHDVRRQLAESVRGGHDVQLHLHPQWQGARRRPDGEWTLDFARWRMGDLPAQETADLIEKGKAWLDAVAFANVSGRSCMAFRAGSWCIQPSYSVVSSLLKNGFAVESTVVPGMRRTSRGQWSDFRSAPELPFWRVDRDVCVPSSAGLWEVPIASAPLGRMRHLSAELQARRTANSRFAPDCEGSYIPASGSTLDRISGNINRLIDLGLVKLDLSTMPATTLIAVTRSWIERVGRCDCTPVVAIAHTKNWTDRSSVHLADYLAWARGSGLRLSTYAGWIESLSRLPAGSPVPIGA
jgi:hypothetical protein